MLDKLKHTLNNDSIKKNVRVIDFIRNINPIKLEYGVKDIVIKNNKIKKIKDAQK